MKHLILSAILLILLTGCVQVNVFVWDDANQIVFQSEYTNYAWGYNHNGWMMDKTGQVKRFQKNARWVFADDQGYLSESDMLKNLAACDSVIAQIGSTELSQYASKASTCVNAESTKPQNLMADAGEHLYAFYVFEPDLKRYKRVILQKTGDWSQENLAPNAKSIVDWMIKIK